MLNKNLLHRRSHTHLSYRLIVFAIAGFLITIGSICWIINDASGRNDWSDMFSIIFAAVGILVNLLQWMFPIATEKTAMNEEEGEA